MSKIKYKNGIPYFLGSLLQLCLGVWLIGSAHADTGADPAELERTWQAAKVYLPSDGPMVKTRVSGQELTDKIDLSDYSVVVYAHGCAGLGEAALDAGIFLSRAGYIVVAPDSFARLNKPRSCDPSIPRGGLHRAVLGWRHAEVDYAIKRLKSFGAHAPSHIFLMGLSEGAITTATYEGEALSGRIIEGWTCHAGWPEYRGLRSPSSEPVLSLVADRDPWFTLPVLQGDCGAYMTGHKNAKSIVFGQGSPLRTSHWLAFDGSVKAMILDFLEVNEN